jgi:molybdopterin converting factor small subunit
MRPKAAVMMKIGFFGKLREKLGDEREVAAEAGETVAGLRIRLAGLYPEAAGDLLCARTRACISDAIVGEEFPLTGQERIEFLPPLSGG